jgi:TRAP-type mannitol/chloroaromatic compound transport system permease small subunit
MKDSKELNTDVNGSSPFYMFIFYIIATLILGSMIVQFIGLSTIIENAKIAAGFGPMKVPEAELIAKYNEVIPYDVLIYALIAYVMGMMGIETGRSVIMNLDTKDFTEKAKCLPKFKRKRLIYFFFTFVVLALIAMVFQSLTSIVKPNFCLKEFFAGIAFVLPLISLSDFLPKASHELTKTKRDK